MQTQKIKTKSFSLLWLLPIIALGIGFYLTYQKINQLGATIKIEFSSANGIHAGSTIISYKDLEIGKITNISLADDLENVIVTAQMNKTAEKLLHEDSEFWVVRPQVTTTGIRGLSTLISGSYITLNPGSKGKIQDHYTGLSKPPITESSKYGVKIHLVTDSSFGLNVGSSVFYRGFKVGQIEDIQFNDNLNNIRIDAFVKAPYDKLIGNNTKFYNISGFNLSVGANGADLQLQSLETLLIGGISFTTPPILNPDKNNLDLNKDFHLYSSLDAINQPAQLEKEYYVLHLDDVSGLTKGSPVVMNGFNLGKVVDLNLLFDTTREKIVSSVLIYIDPSIIKIAGKQQNSPVSSLQKKDIENLVKEGLKSTVAVDNILTGSKLISLRFYPDDKNNELVSDNYSDYQIFPTHDDKLVTAAMNISDILSKVQNLPLDQIGDNLNTLLTDTSKTMNTIDTTAQNLNSTLDNFGKDSSLYYMINSSLDNIQKTMQSVKQLSDTIDDKPNSIIFGK